MGNCLKKGELDSEWGGEEWGFLNSKPRKPAPAPAPAPAPSIDNESRRKRRRENKCKKVRFDAHVEVFGGDYYEESELKVDGEDKKESKVGMEQVRIRITKKQLEELLGKVELESVSVPEMLRCMIKGHLIDPTQHDDLGHKPWTPISMTVPEL